MFACIVAVVHVEEVIPKVMFWLRCTSMHPVVLFFYLSFIFFIGLLILQHQNKQEVQKGLRSCRGSFHPHPLFSDQVTSRHPRVVSPQQLLLVTLVLHAPPKTPSHPLSTPPEGWLACK